MDIQADKCVRHGFFVFAQLNWPWVCKRLIWFCVILTHGCVKHCFCLQPTNHIQHQVVHWSVGHSGLSWLCVLWFHGLQMSVGGGLYIQGHWLWGLQLNINLVIIQVFGIRMYYYQKPPDGIWQNIEDSCKFSWQRHQLSFVPPLDEILDVSSDWVPE